MLANVLSQTKEIKFFNEDGNLFHTKFGWIFTLDIWEEPSVLGVFKICNGLRS